MNDYSDNIRKTLMACRTKDACNAVMHTFDELSLSLAQSKAVNDSPLGGMPFAVKDNLCMEGQRMTCGSRALENYVSPYTATCIQRLLHTGAIPVCSTKMDEFGMGSTGEHCAYGAALHPLDARRVTGGSSSGAAALVAQGIVPFALGSDTGGSVRLPAAYCGLLGFKPTYGALSRYGLTAYASSFDQIGILSASAEMLEAVFTAMTAGGPDIRDSTNTVSVRENDRPQEVLRIGVLDVFFNSVEASASEILSRAIKKIEKRVKSLSHIFSMPYAQWIAPAYYIIACAEANANLGRYDGIRYGNRVGSPSTIQDMYTKNRSLLGAEVQKRIRMGAYVLSQEHYADYYIRAQRFRKRLNEWFLSCFQQIDILLMPVARAEAPFLGESRQRENYEADALTAAANVAGLPAISIPVGSGKSGLPIGIQALAAPRNDKLLLSFAKSLEKEDDFHA